MNFQLEGKLIEIYPIQQVSETFRKREFVIEINEETPGRTFTQYVKFQLLQDKCEIIEDFQKEQQIKVYFSIRGNRWEKDGNVAYFTNLDAWKIEPVDYSYSQDDDIPLPDDDYPTDEDEDLPF